MPRRLPHFMREITSEPDRVPAAPSAILRKALRDTWKINLLYTITVCLASICTALIPWALGKALDSGLENGLTPAILPGVGLFAGLVLVNSLARASEVMEIVVHACGVRASYRCRSQYGLRRHRHRDDR